jgi:hypothetical protein
MDSLKRLLISVFLLSGVSGLAGDSGPVLPEIQARGSSSGQPVEPVLWAVAGSKLPVVINLVAPLGSSAELVFEMIQASEELAVRLPVDDHLLADVVFSDRTSRRLDVSVPMPEVERETRIIVQFLLKSKLDGKVLASTKIAVHVIPGLESRLNPITRLRTMPEGTLLVTGESPRIRDFFDRMKISYVDGVVLSDGMPSVVLCEADEMPGEIPAGTPVLLFSPLGRLFPGVYPSAENGKKIKVTLPILERISTDVQAQKTLVDLMDFALPTHSKNEP